MNEMNVLTNEEIIDIIYQALKMGRGITIHDFKIEIRPAPPVYVEKKDVNDEV